MADTWLDKPKYSNVKTNQNQSLIPKDTWKMCKMCGEKIMLQTLKENVFLCANCDYHFPVDSRTRIDLTFDEDSFVELETKIESVDPLKFKAGKASYKDKLKLSKKSLGINDAIICGKGKIGGHEVMTAIMDFRFIGGSMGSVVGEKIYRIMKSAIKQKCPIITFSCSGGARMQEGLLSLMQMAKTCAGAQELAKDNIPFFSVFTNPTMGGVTASFASIADVLIAEPEAHIGFAGPRVIAQNVNQELPKKFQTSEFLLECGFLDMIVNRREMKSKLINLINLFA